MFIRDHSFPWFGFIFMYHIVIRIFFLKNHGKNLETQFFFCEIMH